jgi:hypothetical protein
MVILLNHVVFSLSKEQSCTDNISMNCALTGHYGIWILRGCHLGCSAEYKYFRALDIW